MRSFIKPHRRDFPGTLEPDQENTQELEPISQIHLTNMSPTRNSPTSPTSGKSNKFQRLFQRSKNLPQKPQTFLSLSSSNITGSPSIIGTRTHEWGTDSPRTPKTRPINRRSVDSFESNTSVPEQIPKEEQQPLPLDTVLEAPPLWPKKEESPKGELEKKNLRRRAQIFTGEKLAEALELGSIVSFEKTRSDLDLVDNSDTKEPVRKDSDDIIEDDNSSSSGVSEFSFEQNSKAGRNTSIRYYKSAADEQGTLPNERDPGFYINDLIEDDDFGDDINYLSEDDEFNDDEELFNRKYFSDDDDPKPTPTATKKSNTPKSEELLLDKEDEEPHTPVTNQNSIFQDQSTPEREISYNKETKQEAAVPAIPLASKRSLKYYQLPQSLDQHYNMDKYSFLEDSHYSDEKSHETETELYDSLLDEINGVPEDYDFESSETHHHHQNTNPIRSKGSKPLRSSLKIVKGTVFENSLQNSKFQSHDKTVTLFDRTRYQSVTNEVKSDDKMSTNTSQKVIYSTPNNSFTSPHPGFINEAALELSPIAEGSIDGSP